MRFAGAAELGPPPEALPTPPPWTPVAHPSTAAEGELPFLSVAQAASLIKLRKLSPVELTQALLHRIERLNPVLNAYITVTSELALKQAREAELEITRGNYLGSLHGIPISLKDLICTAGVLTTGGTGALSDWTPSEDATVWRKLREAGAILLGKTGLHEMAAGFTNLNPFYGPTGTLGTQRASPVVRVAGAAPLLPATSALPLSAVIRLAPFACLLHFAA